ncbi:hypothetical protein A9Q84_06440 [Halobacteriovorax marinus]|uniref:Uncharacterized protein n=1 Tax=Halobacteriovorax marinus TaxID=97084 RepID=A0A1Y5FFA1_9BACT|nr:hypothetical protein A9Q84_06440 [Halobacteriovorax marinus]
MKKMITILALSVMTLTTFAHNPAAQNQSAPKKMKKVVVKGKKAKAIYMALEVEEITKTGGKFTREIKKVGALRCVKAIKKANTSKVKFKCILKGKKKTRRAGGQRGGRNQQQQS